MNKMTKGALATGLGVALLIGGGGTLAVWNDTAQANAGTIAAGDLKLAADPGTWTVNGQKITDIKAYKIVPGQTLTFTQNVNVTLVGDAMKAKFEYNGIPSSAGGFGNTLKPGAVTVTQNGKALPAELTAANNGTVTVTGSVTFDANLRDATNASLDLSGIGYTLTQLPVTK